MIRAVLIRYRILLLPFFSFSILGIGILGGRRINHLGLLEHERRPDCQCSAFYFLSLFCLSFRVSGTQNSG
jgi:hypothetical protein